MALKEAFDLYEQVNVERVVAYATLLFGITLAAIAYLDILMRIIIPDRHEAKEQNWQERNRDK